MVLINSIDGDVSTTDVIRWLTHFKTPFFRLSEKDTITQLSIKDTDSICLSINNRHTIHFNKVNSYWYRRGQLNLSPPANSKKNSVSALSAKAADFMSADKNLLLSFLYGKLAARRHIGRFEDCTFVNKIQVLDMAKQLGLLVPPTLLTGSKKEVQLFQQKNKEIITKAVAESFSYMAGNYWLPSYTQPVPAGKLKKLPATFGLSLFQKKIEKKIEIRAFYLEGTFYSMAIFSQNDPKTKTDFRDYNYKKPNRNVPYKLPVAIEKKLAVLMRRLSFQSGSVDLLLGTDNRYYFLEVNPVGQFGFLSQQCNYQLEKKIALCLAYD